MVAKWIQIESNTDTVHHLTINDVILASIYVEEGIILGRWLGVERELSGTIEDVKTFVQRQLTGELGQAIFHVSHL